MRVTTGAAHLPGVQRSRELNGGAPDGWVSRNCQATQVIKAEGPTPRLFAIVSSWFDADIIEATIANCFAQGCERVYLLDNASPDDTAWAAKKAGATIAEIYETEYYDEDLRIRLQNEIIRKTTVAEKTDDLWWFVLDADEFPGTWDRTPVIESLKGLPPHIRTIGCNCIDLYPMSENQYAPGQHPAECMTHGVWRRGGVNLWCGCGHWKHVTIRYLNGVYDFAHTRGNHSFAVPPSSSLQFYEPDFDLAFFHAPLRRKEDATQRLRALCESGRSLWDDQAINSNGATKRWKSLDDVYEKRWSEVEIPHSQVYGRNLRGITPLPWPTLLKQTQKKTTRPATNIRGLVVCVGDYYANLLKITLPRNMRHLSECLVVTTPDDAATKRLAASIPGATIFETDAFHRYGTKFNKGLAIEEALDSYGRHGWMLIWDADILMPDVMPLDKLKPGCLHGVPRRFVDDPADWHEGFEWNAARLAPDYKFIGYFQLFDADALCLPRGADSDGRKRAWYDVTFAHAGGGDAYFVSHWPGNRRVNLGITVLHLGQCATNWFGTDAESRDIMSAFRVRNEWMRAGIADPSANNRVGAIVERVRVPGYAETGYELPFVQRARVKQTKAGY